MMRTTTNFKHMQTGAAVAKRKEEGLDVQEGSNEMLTSKLHLLTDQESRIAGVLCVRAHHFSNYNAYMHGVVGTLVLCGARYYIALRPEISNHV